MNWLHSYNPSLATPYVLGNLLIVAGYFFVAVVMLLTRYKPQFRITLWCGCVFFLTCGMHHLENALQIVLGGDQSFRETELVWHMILIDWPQGISIWLFAIGIFLEIRYLVSRIAEGQR